MGNEIENKTYLPYFEKKTKILRTVEMLTEFFNCVIVIIVSLFFVLLSCSTPKTEASEGEKNINGTHGRPTVKEKQEVGANDDSKNLRRDTSQRRTGITDELAMDCVTVECYNRRSVLARVSIVNLFGHPILDRYVAPPSEVTDYRTRWSGIRKGDLDGAPDFESVHKEVTNLIKDRIVVVHEPKYDFRALKISQLSSRETRDIKSYFRYLFYPSSASLRKLSECLLGVKIQNGRHDSLQDARTIMKLYVKAKGRWFERLDLAYWRRQMSAIGNRNYETLTDSDWDEQNFQNYLSEIDARRRRREEERDERLERLERAYKAQRAQRP